MIKNYKESQYWGDANYILWNRSVLSNYSISDAGINSLCEFGIPSWVAPNMNFDLYEPKGVNLKLGEDRDDNDIILSLDTGIVTIGKFAKFMNSDVVLMRLTLQIYAVMIEKAIEIDEEAIIENNIDRKLIEKFRQNLYSIDKLAVEPETFWFEEIQRRLIK
jgi:hypothetical protein